MSVTSGGDGTSAIITNLGDATKVIHDTLEKAKALKNEHGTDGFIDGHIGVLGALIGQYNDTFQRLDVLAREEMEAKIGKHFRNVEVQDTYEEFIQVEKEWNSWLEGIDKELASGAKPKSLVVGGDGPNQIKLRDVREDKEESIKGVNGRILVLTFGGVIGGRNWLEEMQCPFEMVSDEKREIYNAMGLFRSVAKTWSTSALTYYAEQVRSGRELPHSYEGVKDDVNQMGGDLILDRDGKVSVIYCSTVPTDRPSIEQILGYLRPLQKADK